jgi:hypothetical protein
MMPTLASSGTAGQATFESEEDDDDEEDEEPEPEAAVADDVAEPAPADSPAFFSPPADFLSAPAESESAPLPDFSGDEPLTALPFAPAVARLSVR